MLDDLRVYNRVLSANEVADLASEPMSAPCQLTVTVTPTSVWENGAPISGTVVRTGAVDSALVVTLASSDASRLAVPATVTIAAGQASGTFELTPQNNAAVRWNRVDRRLGLGDRLQRRAGCLGSVGR